MVRHLPFCTWVSRSYQLSISRVWEDVVSASESAKRISLTDLVTLQKSPSGWLHSMDFIGIFDSTPPTTWSSVVFPPPFAGFLDSSRGEGKNKKCAKISDNLEIWRVLMKVQVTNLILIILWWLVGFHFGGKPSKLHCVQFFVVRIWHWISRQC